MKPICITAQILTAPKWAAAIEGRFVIHPHTGCWEWTGALDRYGYGKVKVTFGGRRRYTGAHRASWIAHRGPILDNLQLDHLCRNRKCVNPFHLDPVTTQENTRRAFEYGSYTGVHMGRPRIELNKRIACSRHGTSDGHWRDRPDGYTAWHCKPCNKARLDAWRARQ